MRLRIILPAINAFGCLLFVLLRAPYDGIYREAWEAAHREPGLSFNSNDFVLPDIACRPLHSWSEWHGGESLGVKAIETVNMVPIAFATFADGIGRVGPAKRISACAWSWAIAVLVLSTSSVQWFAFGAAIDWRVRRRATGV